MDVNVYEREVRRCPHLMSKHCPKKLIVFVVEGLQADDLNETWKSDGGLGRLFQNHIHKVVDTPASMRIRPHRENESVFGDRRIFYVGPELESEHLPTYQWQKSIITFPHLISSRNISKHDIFTNDSDNVPKTDDFTFDSDDTSESEFFSNFSLHTFDPTYNFGINHSVNLSKPDIGNYTPFTSDDQIMENLLTEIRESVSMTPFNHIVVLFPQDESESRNNSIRSFVDIVDTLMNCRELQDENYVYVLSSTLQILSHNTSYPDPRNDSTLVVWSKKCPLPPVNTTLDYFRAFEWLSYLVSKADPSYYIQEEKLSDAFPNFMIEGNLLDVFKYGQSGKTPAKARLNSLEALNVMLSSMNFMEIEFEPVAVVGTMLLIIPWVFLLCIKAWKSVVPAINSQEPTIEIAPHFLDTTCFAILAIVWILGNYWNWELRNFLFYFVSVILFRLFCEELTSLKYSVENRSVTDKLKIAFQILLFCGIVESLFWATTCGRFLYILFISVVSAKIFQGAFSTSNFKIILSLSASALFVGLIYLCPVASLPYYVTVNITICVWMLGGFFAIKYLMDDSTHDRFLMFLCLIEFSMASIFANLYVFQSDVSLAIILSFFLLLSATLPLLGGNDAKCRLLALSVATASFFLFFSSQGEGLLLLALFISCFCSFLMDKASSNVRTGGFNYFCIFPVLFYTVVIVTACEMIVPIACSSLFQSSVLTEIGVTYDFMTFGLVYIVKLCFLLTLFGGTALSSCRKTMEAPCFFFVIAILNLVSFRTFLHMTLLPGRLYTIGVARMFIKHVLMQTLATALFFLYPFIQLMTKGSFFTLCQTVRNVGLDPIKQ
ncbi:hypothetical protein GE061_019160 [Apolygus lucorum]|uniref:Uncharacterized protein n=1 Tax=Apolygus lucorum TaxID=248454 RepID=A0A8S9X7Q5_APOLU|nr:hypothetical protein GE061_019160 [Apolygus lucorum]